VIVLSDTTEKDKALIYEHFRKEINSCNVPRKLPITTFLCAHRERL